MTRVGFVGLGSQGAPMARRIIDAGFATTLWARRSQSLEPFAGTAADVAGTLSELGAASDVLCVCVVADTDVEAVLRGNQGAFASMAPGSIVVVHSTVHPRTCTSLQADFPALHVLDAPVSGGGDVAARGELLVMAGGDAAVLERCRPVLATFADPILHLGPLGAGQAAKLLNNSLFAAQLGLAAEVFAIAAAQGLDRAALGTVLTQGSSRSYAADLVAMMGFDLDALAAGAGALLAKDVGILVDHASLADSVLLDAADAALARMHVARQP